MNFSTDAMSMFGQDSFDKVPSDQLDRLLRRRVAAHREPEVDQFDREASEELARYCRSHGIMGVNLGHMNPRAALQFLKNQIGDTSPMLKESKRGLLNG